MGWDASDRRVGPRRDDDVAAMRGRRVLTVPTADDMRTLGAGIAGICAGGDVILLSGPLGSGKTTFAQGFGAGLGVNGPVVSPTFTIARELSGRFADGSPARLVHVDAYRLGGDGFAPGQDARDALLDELEALGLDEELENPSQATVVLMEWGEQMAAVLADVRLEVRIDRPPAAGAQAVTDPDADGDRIVTLVPVGGSWPSRLARDLPRTGDETCA